MREKLEDEEGENEDEKRCFEFDDCLSNFWFGWEILANSSASLIGNSENQVDGSLRQEFRACLPACLQCAHFVKRNR